MKGIVLSGPDKAIQAKAKRMGLGVTIAELWPPAPQSSGLWYGKTLLVEAGTKVPWDLLPAAWHFLERWDAAVPLWRYGVTAEDVGTKEDRARTTEVVRDLRVLLHAVELVFVRDNADGRALMAAWVEASAPSAGSGDGSATGDKRLAFLRAMYRVKPRMCVLPRSWLAEVQARSVQDARLRKKRTGPLVRVEVMPGRYVQCKLGDEDRVKRQFAGSGRRRGR